MRVLVSDAFSHQAFLEIQTYLQDHQVEKLTDWKSPNKNADALIVRSSNKVDKKLIENFSNIKIIASATSGFDHFNLKDLKAFPNIKFCYSPEANVQSAFELSLFHILNLLRNKNSLNKTGWREPHHLGEELSLKSVSIIGAGRIGGRLIKTLSTIGCTTLAYDPYKTPEEIHNLGATAVGLKEALKLGEIISLHCPLTKLTRHMINETNLSEMSSEAYLINCARGALICSDDLIKALKTKQIKAAALDVFEHEPLTEKSDLRKLENLYWTPHIGAYTKEAQKKSALEAAQQVKNWFEDSEAVLNSVPPDVAWKKDL